ncbi:hypothetical protein D3C72_2497270 [compost metagenome]
MSLVSNSHHESGESSASSGDFQKMFKTSSSQKLNSESLGNDEAVTLSGITLQES